MDDLREFIQTTQDVRELKRALAVQNTQRGRSRAEVAAELGCSVAFVDKWRGIYARQGVSGLRLGYKGSVGYLTSGQRAELRAWIQAQATWDVRGLHAHVEATYGVRYKSRKSYYRLLAEAQITWKKSQGVHPERDPARVAAKREAIQKKY